MSLPPDSDPSLRGRAPAPGDPTEPLIPRVREREATAATYDAIDPAWLARIEDGLRSLRWSVALVAIIALAALGVSIYTLIDTNDDEQGASQGRVAALSDRVSRLEAESSDSADASTTDSLAGRLGQKADKEALQDLREEVSELKSDVDQAGADGADSTALTQLNSRVDRLAQDVADLKSASDTTGTP